MIIPDDVRVKRYFTSDLTSTNYLLRCKAAPAILLIFVTIQQYDQTSLTPFNDGSAISE